MKSRQLIVSLFCAFALTARAQQSNPPLKSSPADPQLLEVGKPVERELRAGEIHSYIVTLGNGQFLDASAYQQKIGLLARVFTPNGDTLTTIDSYLPQVPITINAKMAGNYRIDVFRYDRQTRQLRN